MKRATCLIAAAALVILGTVPALAGDLQAGVKGGMNFANQSADPADSELSDWRSGMALGGYVGVPVSPMFTIQPEALFTMKGDQEEQAGVTGSVKLNYIEVPVLARVGFMHDAAARPSLFAGPAVGFNISAKAEVEGTGVADGSVDVKDQTKSTEFGMVFGGGLDFPVGSGNNNLGLEARYTWGLSNINDSGSSTDVKNGVISIMGTYRFL